MLLSKIDLSSYDIGIINVCGYKHLIEILQRNIAYILSFVIMLSSAIVLSTRLLKINIYGASDVVKMEIMNYLEQNDISIMASSHIDIQDLEKNLLENINQISMVSTAIKGNVLVINVKEKLPDVVQNYADIVSPCNMIVESINCYQGTPKFKTGDIVKKGEVLIGAYIISGETRIDTEPIFEIKYTTYLTGTVEFESITKKLVRTGNKITNSCYNIFGFDFMKTNRSCEYDMYEEENVRLSVFQNLFIPINVIKNTYYELEEITITQDFEAVKDSLFSDSKKMAESKLTAHMTVRNSTQNVIDIINKKLIQTSLEVEGILTND